MKGKFTIYNTQIYKVSYIQQYILGYPLQFIFFLFIAKIFILDAGAHICMLHVPSLTYI